MRRVVPSPLALALMVVAGATGCVEPVSNRSPSPTCSIPEDFRAYEDGGYDEDGNVIVYCVWDEEKLAEVEREAQDAYEDYLEGY